MNFFKKDPVKQLGKFLETIRAAETGDWYRKNLADFKKLVEFLKRELPALEGKTIAEVQAHPAVQNKAFLQRIITLFDDITTILDYLTAVQQKGAVIDQDDLKQRLQQLDDDLTLILSELTTLRPTPSLTPQNIQGEDDLNDALVGVEVRFIIDDALAVFSSPEHLKLDHQDIRLTYFPGKQPAGGVIIPSKRLIQVFHGSQTPEEVLVLFAKLSASKKTYPLNGFMIQYDARYLGRFYCRRKAETEIRRKLKHGEEMIIPGTVHSTELRYILSQQLHSAEAQKDWAAVERLKKILRELHKGD